MTDPASHASRQNTRKSRVISFRITESEYTRLAHRAATAHISVNDLARQLSVSRADRITIATSAECDPALITQIHYIGHNLNQLVKNAHIFGRVSPNIAGLCVRIEALIDEATL